MPTTETAQPAPVPTSLVSRARTWTTLAIGCVITGLAATVLVGADALWLVSLGRDIATDGTIPAGVPFAAAGSTAWANLPVLGEILFAGLHGLGILGLPVAQLVIDGIVLALLARGARRLNAADSATAVVLLLVAIGSLTALGVVRVQLLSLTPFALLIGLLRAEQERPSRRIWLVVPLIAVWGNLHGAVLIGVAITAGYLLLSRMRAEPLVALAVLVASIAALGLNPAGLRTTAYYSAVLGNEAARRRTGLWAPLSPFHPFDLLLAVAAVALLALMVWARRPMWEYPVAAGLAVATATASRHGVWLLLFCAAPAAVGLSRLRPGRARPAHSRKLLTLLAGAALVLTAVAVLASRHSVLGANERSSRAIGRIAAGRVVLAPEPLAESLAATSGVRVWLCNPIDAFSRTDQAAYLDFLAGHGPGLQRAIAAAGVVVLPAGSPLTATVSRAGFSGPTEVGGYLVLVRR